MTEGSGIGDTIAFRVVRQILDHIYGSDQVMEDEDFLSIFRTFVNLGGKWEHLLNGSPADMNRLMDVLKAYVKTRTNVKG